MDEQASMRAYGNLGLPEGTPDHPLVTFALFAYNQEKYVREAIEGAFSQTYSPLEIILSDDCSSDKTFNIMENMARAYQGPHLVRLNRPKNNIGTIDHLLTIARKAKGELIIVASGDDISKSFRTERIVDAWKSSNASALFSGRTIIDEYGEILSEENYTVPMEQVQNIFRDIKITKKHNGIVRNIPGYSAAYSRDALVKIPLCNNKSLNEDAMTTVIFNMTGSHIEEIKDTLIKYRNHSGSISARTESTYSGIISEEEKLSNFAKSSVKFYPYLMDIINTMNITKEDSDNVKIGLNRILLSSTIFSQIYDMNVFQRIKLMIKQNNPLATKIILPRLLGIKFFAFVKKSRTTLLEINQKRS